MYQTDSKLILGDTLLSLKEMPDSAIYLGVTSPPYNKQERNRGWLVDSVVYDTATDALPESEYQKSQIDVLNEIFRVTATGGSFFYNHKIRWHKGEMFHPMDWLRKTLWTVKQEIVWDRTLAANIRGWRFWQTDERIYWLYKPHQNKPIGKELASMDAKMTSVWRGVPESRNDHPAPFPLWLPARIIISLLRDAEHCVVLDPYVGSGTTAVAAKLLGHSYIGIDSSEQYLDMARRRLADSETERYKIDIEQDLHKLKTSFSERKKDGKHTGKHRSS